MKGYFGDLFDTHTHRQAYVDKNMKEKFGLVAAGEFSFADDEVVRIDKEKSKDDDLFVIPDSLKVKNTQACTQSVSGVGVADGEVVRIDKGNSGSLGCLPHTHTHRFSPLLLRSPSQKC